MDYMVEISKLESLGPFWSLPQKLALTTENQCHEFRNWVNFKSFRRSWHLPPKINARNFEIGSTFNLSAKAGTLHRKSMPAISKF